MAPIGLSRRALVLGQIPASELGPAMGALPPAVGRLLGPPPNLSQRTVLLLDGNVGSAPPTLRLQVDPGLPEVAAPRARTRLDREQDPAERQSRPLDQVRGAGLRFDIGDLLRGIAGLAQRVGQVTRNPGLITAGQLVQRIAPAQRPAQLASGPLEVPPGTRGYALPVERGDLYAPSDGQAGYATGALSAEIHEDGSITGTVGTVSGRRGFTVEREREGPGAREPGAIERSVTGARERGGSGGFV